MPCCYQEYDASTPITPVANKARREEEKKTPKRKSLTPEDVLRKRLNLLYKTVLEFQVGPSVLSWGHEKKEKYKTCKLYLIWDRFTLWYFGKSEFSVTGYLLVFLLFCFNFYLEELMVFTTFSRLLF